MTSRNTSSKQPITIDPLPTHISTSTVLDWVDTQLNKYSETDYKNFQAGLIPTIDPQTIRGVRTPILRRIAKTLVQQETARKIYLDIQPHTSYEEQNLHALVLNEITDLDDCFDELGDADKNPTQTEEVWRPACTRGKKR